MKLSEFVEKYGDCEVSEDLMKMVEKKKSSKWMPEKYGKYWFVGSSGFAVRDTWDDATTDNYRRDFLGIFKTKEECERYLEIQKAFKEASFEPDWKDGNQRKYYVRTSYIDDKGHYKLEIADVCWTNVGCQFYFVSREICEGLIKRFDEKDILKYVFGIEE